VSVKGTGSSATYSMASGLDFSASVRRMLGAAVMVHCFLLVAGAFAQQDPALKIREEVSLVTLTATVTDQQGQHIAGLKKEDFKVYEDNTLQEIAVFESQELPVSIGILFDTSGSMEDKLEDVKDAVKHFADTVNPRDDIFLIRFASDVDLVLDSTDDRKRLYRAVDRLEAQGSTSLYEAVAEALARIRYGKHSKKAILIITDGKDTDSRISLDEALTLARRSEVLVYALGIGHSGSAPGWFLGGILGGHGHRAKGVYGGEDDVDRNVLDALAVVTGGRSYYIEEAHSKGVDRIDIACEEVSAELRRQYLLGYYPANKAKDGNYRSIRLETRDPNYIVRSRKGYYAPVAQTGLRSQNPQ